MPPPRRREPSAPHNRARAAVLNAPVVRELFGRDGALAELRARLSAGTPRIGIITGAAGVGKSALVEALVAALRAAGERAELWGQGEPATHADLVVVELDEGVAFAERSAEVLATARRIVLVARAPELAHGIARRLGETAPWQLAVAALDLVSATQLAEHLGVDAGEARDAAERACGYPLLVALEASQRGGAPPPALVPAQLEALRTSDTAWLTAAIVRRLSETLLSAMLGPASTLGVAASNTAFDALRARVPLCLHGGRLTLPETLRTLALDELRVRAPERRTLWARRAQDALLAQLEVAAHDEVPSLVADLLYACRFEPHAASLIEARADLRVHFDASASVRARALAAIDRFEGSASAQLLDAWWSQPGVRIVETRTADGRPRGFALNVALHPESVVRVDDPVIAALCAAVREQGAALAPAERVVVGRFWADYEHHQRVKPTAAQWAALVATEAVVSASVHRDAAHWRAASERPFAELASASVDGVSYGVFGLDRRRESPAAPFARLVATCRAGGLSRVDDEAYARSRRVSAAPHDAIADAAPRDESSASAPLDPSEIAEQLRAALRNVYRTDGLARSPLLGLQRMRPTPGEPAKPPAARLFACLSEQVERLGTDGHDGVLARTLRATYFTEPRKGVAVAEALNMGHSTYRRWLRAAIERITAQLITDERALRDRR